MVGDLLPGDPAEVGQYRLLGRLGMGGMGQVFLGRSPGGRLVAVKVIRPELAGEPGFRRRFAREVRSARNVGGLYTALVVDADPDAEVPWLATAYVPGPSLAEAVEEHGVLPAASLAGLAAGLAEGLAAIHAAGVVHRDLKPSNVLLAQDGPRVIDFGIARAVDTTMLTQSGTVMGSPGFLSPEQAEGHAVEAPSDIFSLGAVLTFAATGEGPFKSGPTPALMYRVVNHEPDIAGVPEELRGLVGRCLAKDPASRPTAQELLTELGGGQLTAEWLPAPVAALLHRYNEPTQDVARHADQGEKPTPTVTVRGVGWRRRGWLAGAAAAAVILAAGGTAFALSLPGNGQPSSPPTHGVTARAAADTSVSASAASPSAQATSSRHPAAKPTVKHSATPRTSPSAGASQPAAAVSTPPPASSVPPPVQTSPKPAQPASALVPSVTGMVLADAAAALKARGFDNIPYLYECYNSANVLDVVTQSPTAGSRLALTSPVHLYLQAKNCATVANVVGLGVTAAESNLRQLGFTNITSRTECAATSPTDVLSQSPAGGTSYGKDQPISLVVDNCFKTFG
jgi:serine/threonine protein kinase